LSAIPVLSGLPAPKEDTDGRVSTRKHCAIRAHHHISALLDGRTLRYGDDGRIGMTGALRGTMRRACQNVERRLDFGVRLSRDRVRLLGRLQTLRGATSQCCGFRAREARLLLGIAQRVHRCTDVWTRSTEHGRVGVDGDWCVGGNGRDDHFT
ncbi:hypothetical protein PFISCL1PPCAC_18924, partial [Pristionchus fissidentatus]